MVAPASEMAVRTSIKFYEELKELETKVLFYYLLDI